jgi:acetyl esterase/lipase
VDDTADVIALRAPDGVDLRHLRAFRAVAEELNFSRAAQRMYLSQPALSRQIKTLERVIGCELLLRDTHRVQLTLAGHALLDHTVKVLAALDEAIAAAQSVGGELNARMMAVWAPMQAVVATVPSVERLRDVFEGVLAAMPVPPELAVRPVRAGGVPALVVGDEPALLYLHGGGYVMGSAYGYRPLVAGVVQATGSSALVPDFRLAPEHPYPAALDDALAAYHWLARRSSNSRIVLVGDSSGCGLALALLLTLRAAGEPMPAGAVLMCPSLEAGGLLSPAETPRPVDEIARAAAVYRPDTSDLSGLPALLIQCARGDSTRAEAQSIADLAGSAGVAVTLEIYATDPHVFQLFWSFLPEAADAMSSAGTFVRSAVAAAAEAAG